MSNFFVVSDCLYRWIQKLLLIFPPKIDWQHLERFNVLSMCGYAKMPGKRIFVAYCYRGFRQNILMKLYGEILFREIACNIVVGDTRLLPSLSRYKKHFLWWHWQLKTWPIVLTFYNLSLAIDAHLWLQNHMTLTHTYIYIYFKASKKCLFLFVINTIHYLCIVALFSVAPNINWSAIVSTCVFK